MFCFLFPFILFSFLEKLVREINRGEDVDLGTAVRGLSPCFSSRTNFIYHFSCFYFIYFICTLDNPHVACVLLKKFVREFPEPLCTFAFYSVCFNFSD